MAERDLAHVLFSPSDLCCIGSCFRGTVSVRLFSERSHGYLHSCVFHLPQVVKVHDGKGTEAEYFGALVSCLMTDHDAMT